VDIMGYSMGGGIAASLLTQFPQRFRTVILSGVGDRLLTGGRGRAGLEAIARALEAEDVKSIADPVDRAFRDFAERGGNDLHALAAIQRFDRQGFDLAKLREAICPVMVIVGEKDTLVGSADQLVATIRYGGPHDAQQAVERTISAAYTVGGVVRTLQAAITMTEWCRQRSRGGPPWGGPRVDDDRR
jgi:pimeloyl-ACP methyl ester carboxylesterase